MSSRRMPVRELVHALDPPPPDEVLRAANAPALPRLPDGRADREARATSSPTTGSTSTRRRSSSAASRTSRTGARDMVPDPSRTSLGLEYFLWDQRRASGRWPRRAADRARRPRLRADRPDRPERGRGRHRRAHAEGVSGLRPDLPGQPGDRAPLPGDASPTCSSSAATASTATTTRTTRCSPACTRRATSPARDYDVWSVNTEQEYHEEGRDAAVSAGAASAWCRSRSGAPTLTPDR